MPRSSELTHTEQLLLSYGMLSSSRSAEKRFWGYQLQKVIKNETKQLVPWGTLFPALRRLEHFGYLSSQWDLDKETGKARRYYTLTERGEGACGAARFAIADTDRPRSSSTPILEPGR